MPYNMWFLTPERKAVSAKQLIDFVIEVGDGQRAELEEGTARNWRRISVAEADGSWGFDIERCGTVAGVAEEVALFRDELEGVEPAVNADWVRAYLTRVGTVYTFHCAVGFSDTAAFALVGDLIESFREDGPGGILNAELEGWSNEDGQHITWEFADRVSGDWWMALRRKRGWTYFRMNLGNHTHRRAFKAGEAPAGVETHTSAD